MMNNVIFETFAEVGPYEQRKLTQSDPSCHNRNLRIKKYRISIEEIDEPIEIIQERIKELWDKNKRNHHYAPLLLRAAKDYGIELK